MPRHERRIRMRRVFAWIVPSVILVGVCMAGYGACRYRAAHPLPVPPTEEDERKGAEREAIRALRTLFPDKSYSVHCVYGETEGNGCNNRSVFNCLSFVEGLKVSFVCESVLSPQWHGCGQFEFTKMTPVSGGSP